MDWKAKVREEIERNQDELIQLWSKLLQIPSENPPGDSRPVSEFIMDYLKEAGIETTIHQASDTQWNLVSTVGDLGDKHLLYCGHSDVVPAGDLSRWEYPPFSGLVKDGYIHGRGASDMKGGLAGLLFATSTLIRLGVPLDGKLSLFVVPDEETGGHLGVPWVLDKGLITGTACVIAEPSSRLNPTIGQKGSCWFEFTVQGVPGHGSLSPLNGESAIVKAAKGIEALQKIWEMKPNIPADVQAIIDLTKAYIKEREPRDFSDVIDHVSVNIGTINGGTKVNIVADRCTVQVDTRVPFGLEYTDVLAEAKRLLLEVGIDVEIRPYGFQGNANWTSPTEDIVKLLVENISEVTGEEAYGVLQWASSDARHFRTHGIPVLQYGPADLSGIHSFNERVPVQNLIESAKVYALTALDYLGIKDEEQK